MKIITATTLTALMLGTTQADYTMKIPLEQSQGGSLPDSSIILKPSNDEPLPEAASTECRYSNVPMYRAEYYYPENTEYEYLTDKTKLVWNQIVISYLDGNAHTTKERFQEGGFWYYVGDKFRDYEFIEVSYYEICREPI
ncbi:hypothetical protein [Pseudomonas aeruginosa]|uniref:hypothetical protein n=1 Tax=Pseudomonas aeruginosa TaxID=287 RepID=UPI000F522332|nr:hypothetical protein [Pseudomonas aeruginosa]